LHFYNHACSLHQQSWEISMKRAVLYLRVSTTEQTTLNQERELREIASRIGCKIVRVYLDHGISGAKGRDKRPAFNALCRDATKRQFDMIMAWSVDRLGRSLQDLVAFLSELHALKIDLFLHQQGLDTTTPAGKALFQMMGVFAEFERAMIQERVRAGLRRARSEGKQLGRPPIAPELENRIRDALKEPDREGVRGLAERFGVSVNTIQRVAHSPFEAGAAGGGNRGAHEPSRRRADERRAAEKVIGVLDGVVGAAAAGGDANAQAERPHGIIGKPHQIAGCGRKAGLR
jgi:DNA invertase Pin-like site-specific DNA recombinase